MLMIVGNVYGLIDVVVAVSMHAESRPADRWYSKTEVLTNEGVQGSQCSFLSQSQCSNVALQLIDLHGDNFSIAFST